MSPYYCVIDRESFRLLYLGTDLEEARAATTEGTVRGEGATAGEAEQSAAVASGQTPPIP